ncbi:MULTISPECIES: agmatinase family protein [Bacillus]|uniref:Agmatinase family protein n=1 Tax=Bacillus stercoris TaxID=2054641 RepID=A0ABU0V700_9BACI|nr:MULTISPECIES: agmatinase family protein [Bacillus]KFF57271.1 hypothetical protein CM50_13680 [Bacillus subtilis] [Bacillus stercoris]MDQ1852680.1 agmatinase family protein [Bacillus stercoris]NLS38892.1 arginase [Bacillus subtilis]
MEIHKTRVVNDQTVKWISDHWNLENKKGNAEFQFLSIPFDYAVSHRPGTRIGPQMIMDTLNSYSLYCSDKRVSIENTRFVDLGFVDIVHDIKQSYQNIERAVSGISEIVTPIFLGGDHSITDPIIRGMKTRLIDQRFGVIMFDTHFDFREPVIGKEHSGHWLKTLENSIDYESLVLIGIGAPIYSDYYMRELEERGALIKTVYDLRREGRRAVIEQAVNHVLKKSDAIYFTIDIDVFDQAYAPGCSVPNPNGLFPYEVIDSVFEICSSVPTVGMDIVEVSPWLEGSQQFTSHIAANIIINYIAGCVKKSF